MAILPVAACNLIRGGILVAPGAVSEDTLRFS
jgi:hypothetical protein